MERDWLEAQLEAGRSIESIAREVAKHPSTVAYWVGKHGLRSRHAERHAAKGAPARAALAALVGGGCPAQRRPGRLGAGPPPARHWLRRYELKTLRARQIAGETERQRVIFRA